MFNRSLGVPLVFLGLVSLAAPAAAVDASVHPFCLQYLLNVKDARFQADLEVPVPVAACNQNYSKAPIEIKDDYYRAEVKGIHNKKPFYQYKVVGLHQNATIVSVAENIGGAGVFSAIALVMGWPVSSTTDQRDLKQQISLLGHMEGGDRCNGGFADVKMTAPATLQVSTRLTPYDLFIYRATRGMQREKDKIVYHSVENEEIEPISMRLMELEPYRDLDTGVTSCIGTATTEYNLDYGTAKVVSVKLDRLITNAAQVSKHKHQACFNKVVREAVPSLPATLAPEKVKAMSATFESQCMGTATQ